MSENADETKPTEETGEAAPAAAEEKSESDLDKAKADVKDAAGDAKMKAGELADKLKDEDVRKKVGDVAGKLKGLRRRI